ncbi:MAG TPA: RcnB family protein [Sphingomonas sp.]|nr:RcnB family protein [Sphingomonas sp.]
MRISFLAALAAATALIPAAASAQNHDRGGWHRGGDDGNSGGREARGGREAARPARPAAPARPQFRAPDRPTAAAPRFDRGRDGRPDRPQPARPADGGWHAQAGGSHAGDRADRTDWTRPTGQGHFARDRNGGFVWTHDNTSRGGQWNDDRGSRGGQWNDRNGNRGDRDGRWNRDRNDHDGGWDRNDRHDGNWNRGSNWRDHDRNGNRGGFDHDWRRDHRYDWRDYRAHNRRAFRLPRYYAPYGWGYGYRRFGIGITLNSVLFGSNYWISDPYMYRLPPAYGPYRWVRYYDDALLVDIRTGEVVDVVYDIFW